MGYKEGNVLSSSSVSLYREKANEKLKQADKELEVKKYDECINESYDYLYISYMIDTMLKKIDKGIH